MNEIDRAYLEEMNYCRDLKQKEVEYYKAQEIEYYKDLEQSLNDNHWENEDD